MAGIYVIAVVDLLEQNVRVITDPVEYLQKISGEFGGFNVRSDGVFRNSEIVNVMEIP